MMEMLALQERWRGVQQRGSARLFQGGCVKEINKAGRVWRDGMSPKVPKTWSAPPVRRSGSVRCRWFNVINDKRLDGASRSLKL